MFRRPFPAWLVLLLGTVILAFGGAAAEAKPAKCLFEIGEKHLIGAVCKFTVLDALGSLRIGKAPGNDAEADVKIAGPGVGVASWSDGRTGNGRRGIGDVHQIGPCWTGENEAGDEAYICAWSPDQDVYLGPIGKGEMFVSFGERFGMDDEVASSSGLDTRHATIVTKASRRKTAYLCGSNHDFRKTCMEENFRGKISETITADCVAKEWTGRGPYAGARFRLLGPADSLDTTRFNGDLMGARWAILSVEDNSLVGFCGACSYSEITNWYKKLCPRTAPGDL